MVSGARGVAWNVAYSKANVTNRRMENKTVSGRQVPLSTTDFHLGCPPDCQIRRFGSCYGYLRETLLLRPNVTMQNWKWSARLSERGNAPVATPFFCRHRFRSVADSTAQRALSLLILSEDR